MIDYIDDTSVAWASYEALFKVMDQLGLTVSEEKLVPL